MSTEQSAEKNAPIEQDPVFRALYDHQMVSTVRDSCSCGAGDLNTLQPSGVAIQRHRRHVALAIRALFRATAASPDEAWDECAEEAMDLGWIHREGYEDLAARNPYRHLAHSEICMP